MRNQAQMSWVAIFFFFSDGCLSAQSPWPSLDFQKLPCVCASGFANQRLADLSRWPLQIEAAGTAVRKCRCTAQPHVLTL
ncbi:hypothetical protein B0J11DRAFT_519688 [Dendryphion nanum]|uniref:Secreted protein n=1 Tax=Dendryphion nanum TaxID=256645 RepID=A0A9P9IUJ8_9PLEO|nr:hypothetical protein B0J11DRAFT_519688 [Dendryphion nanum]